MNKIFEHSEEPILPGLAAATSSPVSGDGTSPSNSPAGPKTEKFGPGRAPASRSRRQAKAGGSQTPGTCGPTSSGSSLSVALASSLANRLLAKLGSAGSMEYSQTWKEKATPAGRSLWAHTASARRTSDKDFTGWPTACGTSGGRSTTTDKMDATGRTADGKKHTVKFAGWPTTMANDQLGSTHCYGPKVDGEERKRFLKLPGAALMAGWATPQASDPVEGRRTDPDSPQKCLGRDIKTFLAGWPTTTRDSKAEGKDGPNRTGSPSLPALALGVITELFLAPTGRRVVLAPEFSLWLMGFPEAWVTAAPGAKDWLEAQADLASGCSKAQETP